jgi:hypothetical protein
MLAAVDKAILTAGLNLNPTNPVPPAADAGPDRGNPQGLHQAGRGVAEDAVLPCATFVVMPCRLKKLVKDKEISEDEERRAADEIEKLTKKFVAEIDAGRKRKGPDGRIRSRFQWKRPSSLRRPRCRAMSRSSWMAIIAGRRSALCRVSPGIKPGVDAVRAVIEVCAESGVEVLTLFAFSSENWQRPADEVSALMDLFFKALRREAKRLNDNNISLRIIGDRSRFHPELQAAMREAEAMTAGANRFILQIAANYGGQWDIAQAAQRLAREVQAGHLRPEDITPSCCKPVWRPATCRCRTCASAPVASTASAISCCGSWPMPSCTSPTCSGRTSNTMPCALRWPISLRASVASVKRASRSKLEPGFNA